MGPKGWSSPVSLIYSGGKWYLEWLSDKISANVFINLILLVAMVITHLISWNNIPWAFSYLKFARSNGKPLYPLENLAGDRGCHSVMQYRPVLLIQKITPA